jgi:predicted nucleic acid-binding protein
MATESPAATAPKEHGTWWRSSQTAAVPAPLTPPPVDVQRTFTIVDLELDDYARMAELVTTYADVPLGTTDAAVAAERLSISEVATLDHRHFHAVRPRHAEAFTLLP